MDGKLPLILISTVILASGCIGSNEYADYSSQEIIEESEQVTAEDLLDNPEEYQGELVTIEGMTSTTRTEADGTEGVDLITGIECCDHNQEKFWSESRVYAFYEPELKEEGITELDFDRERDGEGFGGVDDIKVYGEFDGIWDADDTRRIAEDVPRIRVLYAERIESEEEALEYRE